MADSESTPASPRAGEGPYLTSEDECLLRGEPGLFSLLYSRHLLQHLQYSGAQNQTKLLSEVCVERAAGWDRGGDQCT